MPPKSTNHPMDATVSRTLHLPSREALLKIAPLGPVLGRPDLLAHQASDIFALWHAWEEETGEKQDIPFWAVVWPAARVLAAHIGAHPGITAGRVVLDIGCGGALAAIAAAKAGAARVIANDIDPVALEMASLNAAANGVVLEPDAVNLLDSPCPVEIGLILVGDLFYEKSVSARMLGWLSQARARGAEVLICDASRPFGPKTGVRVLHEERISTDWDLEGTRERLVRLLSLEI